MGAFIRLEDGRVLWGSTISISALLSLTADHVGDNLPSLKVWLADKANRPPPFLDMDLGGIDPALRTEFYAAAKRAFEEKLAADPTLIERSGGLERLRRLLAMRASIERGEPPLALSDSETVCEPIGAEDLDDLWET